MKRKQLFLIFVVTILLCHTKPLFAADKNEFNPTTAKLIAPFADAVGVVKTYPFENKKRFVSCTVFHIGDGWMVSSGHCFLGMQTCLGATVEFSSYRKQLDQKVLTGSCLEVQGARADDAEISGPHEDYVLFKADVVPTQKLDIDFSSSVVTGLPLVTLMYPRPRSGDTYTAMWNEKCVVTKSVASTPQGFLLSVRSFEHNCGGAGGAQGAPLVNVATGKVVGVHQGHGIVNVTKSVASNGLSGLGYAKQTNGSRLKNDMEAARFKSGVRNFDSVVVGAFSPFAFPEAIFGQLAVKVATLEAANPEVSNLVTFRIFTGSETSATIVDGKNASYVISGTMLDTLLGFWVLAAPVNIYVSTSDKVNSVSLQIRDIH